MAIMFNQPEVNKCEICGEIIHSDIVGPCLSCKNATNQQNLEEWYSEVYMTSSRPERSSLSVEQEKFVNQKMSEFILKMQENPDKLEEVLKKFVEKANQLGELIAETEIKISAEKDLKKQEKLLKLTLNDVYKLEILNAPPPRGVLIGKLSLYNKLSYNLYNQKKYLEGIKISEIAIDLAGVSVFDSLLVPTIPNEKDHLTYNEFYEPDSDQKGTNVQELTLMLYDTCAMGYYYLEDYKSALELMNKAIKIDPKGELCYINEHHFNRGNVLIKMGKLNSAIKDFKAALEINSPYYKKHSSASPTAMQLQETIKKKVAIILNSDYNKCKTCDELIILKTQEFCHFCKTSSKNGEDIINLENGNSIKANFVNGVLQGELIQYSKNGEIINGTNFIDGILEEGSQFKGPEGQKLIDELNISLRMETISMNASGEISEISIYYVLSKINDIKNNIITNKTYKLFEKIDQENLFDKSNTLISEENLFDNITKAFEEEIANFDEEYIMKKYKLDDPIDMNYYYDVVKTRVWNNIADFDYDPCNKFKWQWDHIDIYLEDEEHVDTINDMRELRSFEYRKIIIRALIGFGFVYDALERRLDKILDLSDKLDINERLEYQLQVSVVELLLSQAHASLYSRCCLASLAGMEIEQQLEIINL